MIAIIIAGLADMWRGGAFGDHKIHKRAGLLIIGLCVCSVVEWTWWVIPCLIYLNIAGVALGTGDPMGKIVTGHANHHNDNNKAGGWEKWQYIIKTDNAFTNHGILGLLWYLPFSLLYFVNSNSEWAIVPIIAGASFYIAAFISELIPEKKQWMALEGLRSSLLVLLLWAA